jgi:hypothetical protein
MFSALMKADVHVLARQLHLSSRDWNFAPLAWAFGEMQAH